MSSALSISLAWPEIGRSVARSLGQREEEEEEEIVGVKCVGAEKKMEGLKFSGDMQNTRRYICVHAGERT